MTRPPTEGADWIWVENSCRKLARPDEPPVIPRSDANVSKLDCKVLVELSVLLELSALELESVEALESDSLRLLISLASCETGLEDDVIEVEPEVEALSDCALSDAIKLCMKAWNAAAVLDPELDVTEALDEVEVLESPV